MHLRTLFWASLVPQTVKNLPAMWEAWVWSLGLEDILEEGMATLSSILAWRIIMDTGAWRATVHGITQSDMTEQLNTQFILSILRHAFSYPEYIYVHNSQTLETNQTFTNSRRNN